MKCNFTGYITSKGAGSPHISTRFSFPPPVATCRHFSSSWPSRYFYLHSWCILNFSFHLRLLLIYSALWRKAVLDIIWHLEGSWASWHGLPAYPSSPNLHRAHTQLRQRQRESGERKGPFFLQRTAFVDSPISLNLAMIIGRWMNETK